jgi:hypothetical protein
VLEVLRDLDILPRDDVDEEVIHLTSAHSFGDVTALSQK